MSLPAAPKDISAKPTKGSVVAPIDKANKEADVDRKIRFYGVIDAFRKGRMPSNAQIDQTLRYVLDNSPVDINKLSPDGKKLVQDTRDIIATARLMVQEKNADELIQNFVWHTRGVDTDNIKPGDLTDKVPVDAEKAKSDGDQAVKHLRTLLTLVLTNSEVRKLLSDFSLIGRDLLARGAAKGADLVAPPEEKLRQVDQSAPADQFITEGGRVAGPGETPILETSIPGTDKTVKAHPHDDQPVLKHGSGHEQPLGEVRDQAQVKANELKAEANTQKDIAADKGRSHAADVADSEQPDAVADEKKRGMMDKMRGLRSGLSERVPQEHKDNLNDHMDRSKRFFSEEYFPEERRDQFIFRGKKVIMECQKHDDYQESVRWLLGFVEEYASHGRTLAGAGKDHAGGITDDHNIKRATTELRIVLERFANGNSLDGIINAINDLIEDTRKDESLREWFSAVDLYIRKVLLDAGYVLEPECNNHATRLRETGRQFYDEKYRTHFDNLFSTTGNWFKAMGDDPLNKQFGDDWARLTKDLLFDNEGSLKFKPELWSDIRKVILPTLIEQVGYIPIPRVEYSDDALDLVVENLTLQGRNILPNIVQFEAQNYVKFSPYNAIEDDHRHHITLTLEQIQADMRDVAFYYHKKTGLPKMKDSGLADVLLGGEGLSATIHLVSTKRDKSSVFRVQDINVKVDTLKFSIRDSKHDFLYKTLRPLATGLIKRQIQKAIKDALRTGLEYVDGQLVGVRDRMAEAKATEGQSRTEVLKDMFHNQKDEVASKTSSSSNSQFKVVTNKRNSILASQGHPSGWVNRTADVEKSASSGTEWRSDA
ncbi:hypothetical protein CPB83DRAFT_755601 [Crepidotus variabilis]|uniref:Uncharacterized protein n=1 Tax=Crepidotus variabilis TaxID=179855 RepID=A0A9P6ETM3_9AGAR|nr:hypothetical protein CPB83DRAFT_755601 [Crepidotus variabilis]